MMSTKVQMTSPTLDHHRHPYTPNTTILGDIHVYNIQHQLFMITQIHTNTQSCNLILYCLFEALSIMCCTHSLQNLYTGMTLYNHRIKKTVIMVLSLLVSVIFGPYSCLCHLQQGCHCRICHAIICFQYRANHFCI